MVAQYPPICIAFIQPGAIAKDIDIPLPAGLPKMDKAILVCSITTAAAIGFDTFTTFVREAYDGTTSGAGAYQQKDDSNIILGVAVAATDFVIVVYSTKGELQGRVGGDSGA